jgi:hypothetical protein
MDSQRGKAQHAAYGQPTRQSAACRVWTANAAKRSMTRMDSQRGKAQFTAYIQPKRQSTVCRVCTANAAKHSMPHLPLDEGIMSEKKLAVLSHFRSFFTFPHLLKPG